MGKDIRESDLDGLYYLVWVENPHGEGKALSWQQSHLLSAEQMKRLEKAVAIMKRLFSNIFRLNSVEDAYQEFKDELHNLKSGDEFAIAKVDRRFRAYALEWQLFLDHWEK